MTLDKILYCVSQQYGVSVEEIKNKCRKRNFAEPRQVYCFFAKKYTKNSLKKIGDFVNLNYATVIHSIKTIEGLIKTNKEIRSNILKIKEYVNEGYLAENILVLDIDLLSISKAYSRTVLN